MKNSFKNKLRQIIYTACGIFCVGILLCIAMIFPKYYCLFYDDNTLNKVNYTDSKINTFEAAYVSFAEKMHAIAKAYSSGNRLRAVRMNDIDIPLGHEELAKIAREELTRFYQLGVLRKKLKPNDNKLSVCERYTIYETGTGDGMQGISLWKLVFDNKKRSISLYLDEEYHKIYYLEIQDKKASGTNVSTTTYTQSDTGSKIYDSDYDIESFEYPLPSTKWWDSILFYYDLPSYHGTESTYLASPLTGVVVFEAEPYCEINIYEIYYHNESNQEVFKTGMLIEEMIQF